MIDVAAPQTRLELGVGRGVQSAAKRGDGLQRLLVGSDRGICVSMPFFKPPAGAIGSEIAGIMHMMNDVDIDLGRRRRWRSRRCVDDAMWRECADGRSAMPGIEAVACRVSVVPRRDQRTATEREHAPCVAPKTCTSLETDTSVARDDAAIAWQVAAHTDGAVMQHARESIAQDDVDDAAGLPIRILISRPRLAASFGGAVVRANGDIEASVRRCAALFPRGPRVRDRIDDPAPRPVKE